MHESTATRRLREQVEHALASSQSRKVVEPLLERLVQVAPPGSDSAVLAHRTLAEYRLEEHPWRALLHLKQVRAAHPDDDVVLAMAGLAHAMSGNYHAAVAAYRRATQAAPENPWYHHNLGHLLDVALDRPSSALPHLRTAFEVLGEEEPEVIASLVHCLGRLGGQMRERALVLLDLARRRHPTHASLGGLALELGLPALPPARKRARREPDRTRSPIPLRGLAEAEAAADRLAEGAQADAEDPVLASLRRRLGKNPSRFDAARLIWARYCAARPRTRRGRPRNAEISAAAVHRLVMRRSTGGHVTLASIARDYGVDPKAVATHSEEIERAIEQ